MCGDFDSDLVNITFLDVDLPTDPLLSVRFITFQVNSHLTCFNALGE